MNNIRHTDQEWFASWFDSPYYHMLYRNRNEQEATAFIQLLMHQLRHPVSGRILDLACGKGRHSRTLSALGYTVTGMDLSKESIQHAQQISLGGNPNFKVHDMREPFGIAEYSLVLNLFTSFGYFDKSEENEKVLGNIFNALLPEGLVVIDFLNPDYVVANLIPIEQDEYQDVTFSIRRRIESGFVFKDISVNDSANAVDHTYTERVQLFSKNELSVMLTKFGFVVQEVYGNYQLGMWSESSPRTIIIAQKP